MLVERLVHAAGNASRDIEGQILDYLVAVQQTHLENRTDAACKVAVQHDDLAAKNDRAQT